MPSHSKRQAQKSISRQKISISGEAAAGRLAAVGHKYDMLINEVTDDLKRYTATIRVKQGGSSTTVKTLVVADGLSQARAILSHVYGASNVLNVASAGSSASCD